MPLSIGAATLGRGPRTWPLGSIRWRRGLAVKALGGGTEARGPEESEWQAAVMQAPPALPRTVDRRHGFTEGLPQGLPARGATPLPPGAGCPPERGWRRRVRRGG